MRKCNRIVRGCFYGGEIEGGTFHKESNPSDRTRVTQESDHRSTGGAPKAEAPRGHADVPAVRATQPAADEPKIPPGTFA
jgi:hypothetical protein